MLTKELIRAKIKEQDVKFFETIYDYISGNSSRYTDHLIDDLGLEAESDDVQEERIEAFLESIDSSTVKILEDDNDGDGNSMYATLQFKTLDNMLVSLGGYYSSYDSSEWTDVFESMPVERTVIDYVPIK